MLAKRKYIAVTASTGIARLHFADGLTLHDWSGYGDGHMDINHLIRWFKFTLKPPYSEASERSLLAIWDTSHWNFFVKFGLRTA